MYNNLIIVIIGCFAHARRKWVDCFVDGKPVKDSMSEKAFQLIERIFALESTWKALADVIDVLVPASSEY